MQAMVTVTFWLGLATLAGVTWLGTGGPFAAAAGTGRWLGGLLVLTGPGSIAACAVFKKPISWRRWSFSLPRAKLATAQVCLGMIDIAVAGSVLWVLLPVGYGSWGAFLALFTGALATGRD